MYINIKASDVAAICGKNPYKSKEEIFNERINTYFGTTLSTEKTRFDDALSKEDHKTKVKVEEILNKSKDTPLITNDEIKDIPETIKEYVKHEIYKNNGTLGEDKTRSTFSVQTDKSRYTMPIYKNIRLVGYIDGRTENGRIVEIKNRQNRLFGRVPEYERIQVQVYMKLTGTHTCMFIEQYKDKTNEFVIEFNESDWQNIFRDLKSFAKELYEYQNGEDSIEDQE